MSLVLYNDPDFVDFTSYSMPWYDNRGGDTGLYGEPLSFSEGGHHDDSHYLAYDEVDDSHDPSQSWYVNGSNDQENRGTGSWLLDYESYFGELWVENEASSARGYDEANALNKEQSLYAIESNGNYYGYNDEKQRDYSDNQWLGFYGFSSRGGSMDEFRDHYNRDFLYNNESWNESAEMMLYGNIFANLPGLVTGDKELEWSYDF